MRRSVNSVLFVAFVALVAVFYNNCNGVPYGGLIPTGKYYAANKTCSAGNQDYLEISNVDGTIKGSYIIPCQNTQIPVEPTEVKISLDNKIIIYNEMGFAYEDTERAKQIDNYRVACRVTEQTGFNEVLVYGTKPNYILERILQDTEISVERIQVTFSGTASQPYVFSNGVRFLSLMPKEIGDDFTGSYSNEINQLICDNLSSEPVSIW